MSDDENKTNKPDDNKEGDTPNLTPGHLRYEFGGLTYVLDRAPRKTGRSRAVITVTREGADASTRFVDRVDLLR